MMTKIYFFRFWHRILVVHLHTTVLNFGSWLKDWEPKNRNSLILYTQHMFLKVSKLFLKVITGYAGLWRSQGPKSIKLAIFSKSLAIKLCNQRVILRINLHSCIFFADATTGTELVNLKVVDPDANSAFSMSVTRVVAYDLHGTPVLTAADGSDLQVKTAVFLPVVLDRRLFYFRPTLPSEKPGWY